MVSLRSFLTAAAAFVAPVGAISVTDDWNHGSSVDYNRDGNLTLAIPQRTRVGDTLVMFLSRSDGPLPSRLMDDHGGDWQYAASCFKHMNGQQFCYTVQEHCRNLTTVVDDDGKRREYCFEFIRNRNGQDLCTVVFTRAATPADVRPDGQTGLLPDFELRMWHNKSEGAHWMPGWGLLLAVRGTSGKLRGWNGTTCDRTTDSHFGSVPDSRVGDLMLLSMTYDDTAVPSMFLPPDDETAPLLAFVNGRDEAGFVWGGPFTEHVPSDLTTKGVGGFECKDMTMSLVFEGDEPVDAPTMTPATAHPTALAGTGEPTVPRIVVPAQPTDIGSSPLNPGAEDVERLKKIVETGSFDDEPTSAGSVLFTRCWTMAAASATAVLATVLMV